MDKGEFLLLIPGIIYGVGMVDLLKVVRTGVYWEVFVWALILFVNLILQWFVFYDKLSIVSDNLPLFTLTMLGPMLFTKACTVLTPEVNQSNTRGHFLKNLQPFFLLLGAETVINVIINEFVHSDGFNWIRLSGMALLFVAAFYHQLWFRVATMMIYVSALAFVYLNI